MDVWIKSKQVQQKVLLMEISKAKHQPEIKRLQVKLFRNVTVDVVQLAIGMKKQEVQHRLRLGETLTKRHMRDIFNVKVS
jgi:ribosomal protein L23